MNSDYAFVGATSSCDSFILTDTVIAKDEVLWQSHTDKQHNE